MLIIIVSFIMLILVIFLPVCNFISLWSCHNFNKLFWIVTFTNFYALYMQISLVKKLFNHTTFLLNTLKLFWFILGQWKTSLVIFLWERRTSSVVFLANIISNGQILAIRKNIVAKKTTELVLLFHKNINKLVFHWLNMSEKSFKL